APDPRARVARTGLRLVPRPAPVRIRPAQRVRHRDRADGGVGLRAGSRARDDPVPSPDQPTVPVRSGRVHPSHALAILMFAAISIVYFGLPLRTHFSDFMIEAGPDASAFAWYLKWWPHALATATNPFVSYQIWAPTGVNLAWTTSIPALALIM